MPRERSMTRQPPCDARRTVDASSAHYMAASRHTQLTGSGSKKPEQQEHTHMVRIWRAPWMTGSTANLRREATAMWPPACSRCRWTSTGVGFGSTGSLPSGRTRARTKSRMVPSAVPRVPVTRQSNASDSPSERRLTMPARTLGSHETYPRSPCAVPQSVDDAGAKVAWDLDSRTLAGSLRHGALRRVAGQAASGRASVQSELGNGQICYAGTNGAVSLARSADELNATTPHGVRLKAPRMSGDELIALLLYGVRLDTVVSTTEDHL